MPKLTDTQLVILSAAAKREDRAVLPLPKSLKCNKGAATSVLKSLLGRGLVIETAAAANEAAWREEDDQRFGLALADVGLQALGIEPAGTKARQPKSKSRRTTNDKQSGARSGTKISTLVDLLKRKNGATIPDIAAATGWQNHSVRGAISGALKKKMGLTVVSTPEEGRGRVYRIV
jgi:hypothetical protein